MNQPTAVPTRKVGAGVLAGAISVLIMFIVSTVWPELPINAAVGSAVTTILTFIVSYFVPNEE